jgi:peptidyl-prolyl cis-trans isomerase A (cyclophilin A)
MRHGSLLGSMSIGRPPGRAASAARAPALVALCVAITSMAIAAPAKKAPAAPAKKAPTAPKRPPGLYATLNTSAGAIVIKLYEKEAPKTVANFVGLASGTKEFTDPKTGKQAKRPYYNGIIFHRVVKGFMIQGGDPLGTGTGGPGYEFEDELPTTLDYTPGTVAMANAGPNTNGSQFFIMHGDYSNRLPKNYSIFGKVVQGTDVVNKIASAETTMGGDGAMSKPLSPVKIVTVRVERVGAGGKVVKG